MMAVCSVVAHRAVAFAKAWSPHAADSRCVVTFNSSIVQSLYAQVQQSDEIYII